MLFTWLFFLGPLLVVWLIGAGLALSRWPRHPQVSAWVLCSVGAMVVTYVGYRIGLQVLPRPNVGGPSFQLGYAILGITASLLRAVAWIAILIAVFGWRESNRVEDASRHAPFQFSIRGLLILTLCVALLCVGGRMVVSLLGESAMILLTLIDDIPVVIAWLCGAWLSIARYRWHPMVSRLALAAILLNLSSFVFSQGITIYYLISRAGGSLLGVPNGLWAVIGPLVWSLLLAAAFGWRARAAITAPAQSA